MKLFLFKLVRESICLFINKQPTFAHKKLSIGESLKAIALCLWFNWSHVIFTAWPLTKILNSIRGFLSKAVIHGVDSQTKWSGNWEKFSRQLILLLGLHYPENCINSLFYFLFVSICLYRSCIYIRVLWTILFI